MKDYRNHDNYQKSATSVIANHRVSRKKLAHLEESRRFPIHYSVEEGEISVQSLQKKDCVEGEVDPRCNSRDRKRKWFDPIDEW